MSAINLRMSIGSSILPLLAVALLVFLMPSPAQAQVSNLQDLIQNLLGQTGTTSTPTGTTSTSTGQTPTSVPTSGTRQTIITNQFTSATGGAIASRRPGLWVEQSIAVHQGDTSFFTGVPAEQPNFFKSTFDQIFAQLTTVTQGLLDAINTFVQNTFKPGGSTGGGGGTPFTPATTGQGTQNPIQ
jgi:hypothetical protein